jgi:hypothetical protein
MRLYVLKIRVCLNQKISGVGRGSDVHSSAAFLGGGFEIAFLHALHYSIHRLALLLVAVEVRAEDAGAQCFLEQRLYRVQGLNRWV